MKGLKGYLTVFLSLSMTLFLSIFLGLIGGALRNLGKLRFECAADIGMNSLLGEFHRELLEQYDLLFVDVSYGSGDGRIANMEEHLRDYMEKNMNDPDQETSWNELELGEISTSEYVLASDYEGAVMQRQACAYMRENKKEDAFADLHGAIPAAGELDSRDGMELWSGTMSRISAIALPLVMNVKGEWEEVPLDNPADKVFGSSRQQILNLCYVGGKGGTGTVVTANSYLSHRNRNRGKGRDSVGEAGGGRYLFQSYLFEKCGNWQKKKPEALLEYQIEYIIFGDNSDRKNISAAVKRIFKWKFSDYIRLYFGSEAKYREAEEIAKSLYAVRLKPEFAEPVTHSILYAWAFLDSIYDTGVVMEGGRVPLTKEAIGFTGGGLDYGEYLWLMLSCESEETINLRAMDIMEMDIRQTAYNENFHMDWCLESYRVRVAAVDQTGAAYDIDRKYGYY